VGFARLYLLHRWKRHFQWGLVSGPGGSWKGPFSCPEVMARLQLATAAIVSAEAVGMEGDLDDLMSLEEDSMGQGEEGPSQDQ